MKDTNVKEVLGSGVKFYPDLPREDFEALVGSKFQLLDGKVIDDWDAEWGTSQFALMKLELSDKKQVTTICGGKAVVRQISRLVKRGYLPGRIWCLLNKLPSGTGKGDYYLLDWDDKQEKVEEVTEASFK